MDECGCKGNENFRISKFFMNLNRNFYGCRSLPWRQCISAGRPPAHPMPLDVTGPTESMLLGVIGPVEPMRPLSEKPSKKCRLFPYEYHSSTKFACTLYSNLMVLNSNDSSSSTAVSIPAASAARLRIMTALLL